MHDLGVFSLQAALTGADAEARLDSIDSLIDSWLSGKGAPDARAQEGKFKSLTGEDEGKFIRKLTKTSVGSLREIQLVETTASGQIFTTEIFAAKDSACVTIFSSLSVMSVNNVVTPVQVYPRCPKVIRTLVELFNDWTLGGQLVPTPKTMEVFEESTALNLCDLLQSPARNLPIVVVSVDPDEVVWPELPHELSRDLVGIAQVAAVDEEGSWVLTDELGKQNSCYLGAVRLYWPVPTQGAAALKGTVWTATHLIDAFGAGVSGMKRFLSQMRRTVMSTAALTIARPKIIGEIQSAAMHERFLTLGAEAREKELESIVDENSQLVLQLNEARQQIAQLQRRLAYSHNAGEDDDNATEDQTAPSQQPGNAHTPALAGELRHYKKIGKKGEVDNLVVTKACNHNESSWRPAFKAVQAEKGVQKLEGRNNWKSFQKCSACTGGGRWRVQW
jgi:hypothetical protein